MILNSAQLILELILHIPQWESVCVARVSVNKLDWMCMPCQYVHMTTGRVVAEEVW